MLTTKLSAHLVNSKDEEKQISWMKWTIRDDFLKEDHVSSTLCVV